MYTNSVTRLNFLAAIFLSKVVQIFANFSGYFENISFKVKPDVASFAQLLVTIGLIYNLASGHTGQQMNVA